MSRTPLYLEAIQMYSQRFDSIGCLDRETESDTWSIVPLKSDSRLYYNGSDYWTAYASEKMVHLKANPRTPNYDFI